MMRTAQIPKHWAVEEAVLVMAMTMTMARVRRTPRAVRKWLGMGREQQRGRGTGRWLSMGREIGRGSRKQRGKGMGRAREIVKGKIVLHKPQGEIISLLPLLWSWRGKSMRQTLTWRADWSGIFIVGCIAHRGYFLWWWYRLYQGVRQQILLTTWFWCGYAHGGWCVGSVPPWFGWRCG